MDGFLLDISSYTTHNELFEKPNFYIRLFKSLTEFGFTQGRYNKIKHYIDNPLVQGFEVLVQNCEDKSKKTYILQARFNSMDDLLLAKLSLE